MLQQPGGDILKQSNVEDVHNNGYQKQISKPIIKDEHVEGIKNENNRNKGTFIENKEDVKTDILKEEYGGKIVGKDVKNKENNGGEYIPEFAASKSDPKYQTLPYNTKFGMNYKNAVYQNGGEPSIDHTEGFGKSMGVVNPVGMQQPTQQQQQQPLMTVHSTPILAPSLSSASKIPSHLNPR